MTARGSGRAAGFDISAVEPATLQPGEHRLIQTGLAIACPSGTYARIAPRSGQALQRNLSIGAGVADADYRGEVGVLLINTGTAPYQVTVGDRIAQLVLEKVSDCSAVQVSELPPSARGAKGFGSAGMDAAPAGMTNPTFYISSQLEGHQEVAY